MNHTIRVDTDDSLFTVTTEGDGDPEGIIAFLKDLISHPQWKPGSLVLLDHRKLCIENITGSGIERVSHFFKSIDAQLGNGKIALVMNRNVDFGIARAWEILTEDNVAIRINVFRNLDDGLAWLRE